MQLEKVNMPACPRCGCNATLMIGAGERYGRPWAKLGCTFCDHVFSLGVGAAQIDELQVQNGVKYQAIHCRCPECNAVNPPVKSTRGNIRFHRCDRCQTRFKSVEA